MRLIKNLYIFIWLFFIQNLTSCSEYFEYSPYDIYAKVRNLNSQQIQNIQQLFAETDSTNSDTLCFAFISDTHNFYDNFRDAINYLNKDTSIRFIIIGGDITNLGLSREYEWFSKIVSKSNKPYVTLIGNHDYLSNGKEIYLRMFGLSNFSFMINQYKLICFDDVVWENNNQIPDFNWLKTQLSDTCYKRILITHIPPWSDQIIDSNNKSRFDEVLNSYKPILMLMGHTHRFDKGQYNGIPFAISGTIEDRTFLKVKIYKTQCWVEKVDY